MAETKETVILDFQVQEADAISSLERTKKSIVELKKEQADLNKAYKEGAVSLDQYAKESVQLEASLKKQQASYNTIQRTVTGLKNPFDKLNESIKEQAKQVTVAGVSLSSFANPATATVAVLGALFKGYASSTIGAKDLAFASNQLSFQTNMLANNLANLVSSAKDGQGFFTSLLNAYQEAIGAGAVAAVGRNFAMMMEELEDLQRERVKTQADNNKRLAENADIMEKLADSQVSYNEKLKLSTQAITNIAINRDALLKIAERELEILNLRLAADKENEKLQDAIGIKEREIEGIRLDADRATSRIEKTESNILDAKNKQVEAQRMANAELETANELYQQQQDIKAQQEKEKTTEEIIDGVNRVIEAQDAKAESDEKAIDNAFKLSMGISKVGDEIVELTNDQKKELAASKNFTKSLGERMNVLQGFGAMLQMVGGQTKELALAGVIIEKIAAISQIISNTGIANAKAVAASPLTLGQPWVAINTASAAFSIASTIASAATAVSDLGAAAGGGSFYTKGPQLLMVGDNPGGVERVDVTPVSGKGKTVVGKNMIAMAGGGTMYTDAAMMANSRQHSQQTMQPVTVNMIYSEYKDFENMVRFKEKIATA